MELYVRVRRACMVEGMSTREAARVFGLHRDTVRKMLKYSVPPGYRRQSPPRRPKLDPYHGVIDRILDEDGGLPKKQRHTAKRIYDRLRAEHGFGGRYTIVKDYVRERLRRTRRCTFRCPILRRCPVRLRAGEGGDRRSGGRPSTTSCWTFPTATRASSRPNGVGPAILSDSGRLSRTRQPVSSVKAWRPWDL